MARGLPTAYRGTESFLCLLRCIHYHDGLCHGLSTTGRVVFRDIHPVVGVGSSGVGGCAVGPVFSKDFSVVFSVTFSGIGWPNFDPSIGRILTRTRSELDSP